MTLRVSQCERLSGETYIAGWMPPNVLVYITVIYMMET